MNPSEIQRRLDALTYPPNHCYDFLTMQPTNEASRQRFNYLIPHIQPLIKDKTVIDIGCNKGYFAIWSALHGARHVIAQDIKPEFTDIVAEIARHKNCWHLSTISTPVMSLTREGDIALVLGVAHYLTFEHSLDWLYKLYYLGYDILLEFPLYISDPIVKHHAKKVAPERLFQLTEEALKHKIEGLYSTTYLGQSPDLHRNLYLLKKVPLPITHQNQITNARKIETKTGSTAYLLNHNRIFLLKTRFLDIDTKAGYKPRWCRAQQILTKEFPGIVPQLLSLVIGNDGRGVGIIEQYVEGGDPRQGIKNLFHIQLYLLKLGLISIDIHPNNVHGSYVIDHESIEPWTTEAEEITRKSILEKWQPARIENYNRFNPHAINQLKSLITKGENLKTIMLQAQTWQWYI